MLSQETAIRTLKRALGSGRVHHAYLFDGPDGVGKGLAAQGFAQALVCERRGSSTPADDACGECSACRRAVPRAGETRPLHPDVVFIERGLYEPGQIGRRTPETQDISIDQVRTLVLGRAAFGPHEGRAKVFIVRRAEELSAGAANALLKTLEEPGPSTHFVLLTSQPDTLLSTIRSRTLRVRFGPLPDDTVARLLAMAGAQAHAESIARLAGGSMQTALALADADTAAARETFVARAIAALAADTLGPALELAEEFKKNKAALASALEALAHALATQACQVLETNARRAGAAAARYRLALAAIRELDANASPQLVVESMMIRMRGA